MSNIENQEDYRIYCGSESYTLFAVPFNVKDSFSKEVYGAAVTNIVGISTTREDEIYRTADESARSWGGFDNPNYDPIALMNHLLNIELEPVSIERIAEVHGIVKSDPQSLAEPQLRRSFD